MRIKNFLRDCPEFIAGDATHLREIINPLNDTGFAGRYSLAHTIVEPGKKSTPHKMLTSEAYYILEGSGIMHIAEEHAEVSAGDFIDIPSSAVQWIENIGKTNLVFLCIVDTAWRKEDEIVLQ